MCLNGCSKNKAYGSEEAIKKGDVVYLNKVFNLARFEQFLTNLSNKKEDTIRVTGYTDEGDPIFQDLRFDGKLIHYRYDNSNDAFGGNNTGIVTDVCTKIIEEENVQGEIDYLISGCSKNPDNSYFLIRVEKNKLK
jgi:Domain of unknown function (DUF4362)